METASVKAVRESEADFLESGKDTPEELMKRAANGIYGVLTEHLLPRTLVTILSGKGNNGGDGYALAALLADNHIPHRIAAIEATNSDTAAKFRDEYAEIAIKQNLHPIFEGFSEELTELPCGYDNHIIVDCMLGTGIRGALRSPYAEAAEAVNRSGAFVISCDMPSGLNDSGRAKLAVRSDVTAAIGCLKDAYYLNDGRDFSGSKRLIDIGIPKPKKTNVLTDAELVKTMFEKRANNCHKGTFGTAVIVGCSAEYVGAGELAAISAINTLGITALRCGAGLVRLVVPSNMLPYMWGKVRDCSLGTMKRIDDYRASAYAYGMGVGDGDAETLGKLISKSEPLVIDADGLNLLSKDLTLLKNAPEGKEIVLTPHVKEMSRLTGADINDILNNPIDAAEKFASEYGVTLLLKGTGTVITNGEKTYINANGSPCLAKGGSGDVLSGIIAAMLARGVPALEAGAAAAYILGAASEIAKETYGEYSTLPTDIARAVKKITVF